MMVRGSYVLNGVQVIAQRCGGEEIDVFARLQSGCGCWRRPIRKKDSFIVVICVFYVSIKGGCWM